MLLASRHILLACSIGSLQRDRKNCPLTKILIQHIPQSIACATPPGAVPPKDLGSVVPPPTDVGYNDHIWEYKTEFSLLLTNKFHFLLCVVPTFGFGRLAAMDHCPPDVEGKMGVVPELGVLTPQPPPPPPHL